MQTAFSVQWTTDVVKHKHLLQAVVWCCLFFFYQIMFRVHWVKAQPNTQRLSLSAAGRMSLYRALAPAGILPADVKISSSAARLRVLGGESQRSSRTPPAFELLITWLGLASVQLGWGCRGGRRGTCNNLSICSRGQMGGLCGLRPVRTGFGKQPLEMFHNSADMSFRFACDS